MNFLFPYMARWKAVNWSRYHQIFTRLAEMGHQVYILQPPSSNMQETGFQEIEIETPKNLHLIDVELNLFLWNCRLPLNKLIKKGYYSLACRKAVRKIIQQYGIDVLFLYNIPQLPLMDGNSCVKVFDFADDYIAMLKHELGFLNNGCILKLAQSALDKMIKKSDLTLVVSSVLAETIKGRGGNIKVVPNGAALEFSTLENKTAGNLEYKKPVIGFVGSFEYFIDFDLILAIAERLPAMTFLLVGGGRDLGAVKNKALEKNLENIIFTGPVAHGRIANYINKMDVCLNVFKDMAVSHAACPIKLLEYLLMKKPVISNRLKEVLLIDTGFIFYADTVEEFIAQINLALTNKTLASERASKGYDIVTKEYSWDNITFQLLNLIEELKSKKPATKNIGHS
jgi:glycosyltransferase involved in cell wall biosynthesis